MQKAPKAAPLVLSLVASAPGQHRLKTKCPSRFYLCRDYLTSVFQFKGERTKQEGLSVLFIFSFQPCFSHDCPALCAVFLWATAGQERGLRARGSA